MHSEENGSNVSNKKTVFNKDCIIYPNIWATDWIFS